MFKSKIDVTFPPGKLGAANNDIQEVLWIIHVESNKPPSRYTYCLFILFQFCFQPTETYALKPIILASCLFLLQLTSATAV